MNRVIIGLGSNIRPEKNIALAVSELEKVMKIIHQSDLIRTKPIGITDQPDFLNGAVLVDTPLDQNELRKLLKKLEDSLGRDRTLPKFGPRTIDLDILTWNGEVTDKDYETRDFLKKLVDNLLSL